MLFEPSCPLLDAVRYTGVQLCDDQVAVPGCQLLQVWGISGVAGGGNHLVLTRQQLLDQATPNTPGTVSARMQGVSECWSLRKGDTLIWPEPKPLASGV